MTDFLLIKVQCHFPVHHPVRRRPDDHRSFEQVLQMYATQKSQRDNIRLLTQHHVRVEPGKIYVEEQGKVHFGLPIWSTGLALNPPILVSTTETETGPKTKRHEIERGGKVRMSTAVCSLMTSTSTST
ncbi:uncharacterized protein C8Q71DRAFT_358883 [Rhodofomes roseus]|uniref:Uncharacterized protein n=1 Tax=Rhodofomes roseus TaxID=34475 RepID=A0ABQ8K1M6_9APHY|nr:uncharacterized protein C8Q71DRAFT_358883 [Rhodofomes roseus]KAH9830573.1 hypothetical protein C8Q71DRAFT_358883 [Rhodofomes roseus]